MACLTPATCHSLTSRYSLSASAARNDRLRPVLLASFSSRLLTSVSTRTVNVVEDIAKLPCNGLCTNYHKVWVTANSLRLLANTAFCGAVKTLEANHPRTATGPCFSGCVTSTPLLTSKMIKRATDPLPACQFRGAIDKIQSRQDSL